MRKNIVISIFIKLKNLRIYFRHIFVVIFVVKGVMSRNPVVKGVIAVIPHFLRVPGVLMVMPAKNTFSGNSKNFGEILWE